MTRPLSIRRLYEAAREGGRPLIGGHRGNPAEHPENTLASFRSAIELGVDMIECDVHLSSDRRLVVIHDPTLERTTNGTGLVRERSLAELRRLDAGGGERLPLLEEVIELARGVVGLCIEIKHVPSPYPGLEEQLVAALRAAGTLDQTCAISFHHPAIAALKRIEPSLQAGILEEKRAEDPVSLMRAVSADIFSPHWTAIDADGVARVHAAGGAVGVWTVDDAAAVAACRLSRPDSIFTNRPSEIASHFR